MLEAAPKDGVTAAAKAHGISRFSIDDWQRRLTKAAAGAGPSPTRGPAHDRHYEAVRPHHLTQKFFAVSTAS